MVTLQPFRAFTTEFLFHIHSRGGFPLDKLTREWMTKHFNGVAARDLSGVRNGQYAPTKCTTGLIRLMLDEAAAKAAGGQQSRTALLEFMKFRGFDSVAPDDLDLVLSHTCTSVVTASPEAVPDVEPNAFLAGPSALAKMRTDYMLSQGVRACRPYTADIQNAVRWMFIRVAQLSLRDGPSLSHDEAVRASEQYMRVSLNDYVAHATRWHSFNRWIVVLAKGDKTTASGMSIVLPLSERAYLDVLHGRLPTERLSENDLVVPSNHLFLEAVSENPELNPNAEFDPSIKLLMCVSLQLAALMRYGSENRNPTFRWLSFAATPRTREVLLNAGYKVTGKRMANTGWELLERTLNLETGVGVDSFLERYILGDGSVQCPTRPPDN